MNIWILFRLLQVSLYILEIINHFLPIREILYKLTMLCIVIHYVQSWENILDVARHTQKWNFIIER